MMLPGRGALDRSGLCFFIAGPGPGEGLAIALPEPEGGWIFIDGCKATPDRYPLHEIWDRYKREGERVEGVVLTHPHQDHYEGMLDLIDLTSPRWIACVATHHADDGVLLDEALARRDDPLVEEYPGLLVGSVKDLLARIQNEWNWGLSAKVLLRAGGTLPVARPNLTIDIVAPDPAGTRAFFRRDAGLPKRIRERANEVSAVLHVHYGDTRLVLGGDLPEHDHNVGPRTGWTKVLLSFDDVPGSLVLKVPHHGSDGAMHSRMIGPGVAPAGAIWTLTPFRGGKKRDPLPKLRNGQGVAKLLEGAPRVYLTSLPSHWTTTAPLDRPVPINVVDPPSQTPIPGVRFKARVDPMPMDPLDAVWLFTLNSGGQCTAMFRGDRALEITRTQPARAPRARGASAAKKPQRAGA